MSTNTYVALDQKTAVGSVSSVEFTSIPSTYTDLMLVVQAKGSQTQLRLRFNSDSNSNYSVNLMYGDGSSNGKVTVNNDSSANIGGLVGDYGTNLIHLNSYSNTNVYKTALGHYGFNGSYNETGIKVCTWRNTNAITSILVFPTTGTFDSGSTFSLYGIRAWVPESSTKATGGYVSQDSTYWYHAFPFSSTFTPNQSLTADILVVAGGGGGGNGNGGGGGGAGGVLGLTSQSLSATGYTVTIGAGGAMSADGASSSFASSVALKGGRGADAAANGTGGSGTYGSGGGCGRDGGQFGGAGTSGQGFAGGNSAYPGAGVNGGSGGGGAGGVGQTPFAENFDSPYGNGGIGTNVYASWLDATGLGVAGYIAGGGGGSGYQVSRNTVGGLGGGGRGTMREYGDFGATPGVVSTGSGGGGGGTGAFKSNGMPGGSGLVIVRYAK